MSDYQYVVPLKNGVLMSRLAECGLPVEGPSPPIQVADRLTQFLGGGLLMIHHTANKGSWVGILPSVTKTQIAHDVYVGSISPSLPPTYFEPKWKQ